MFEKTNIEKLYKYGMKVQVKKDTYLYNANSGTNEHSAFLLEDGLCALQSLTRDGEEKIYLYFDSKRIIGFAQIMRRMLFQSEEGAQYKTYSIVAKTDCTLYRISDIDFFRLVKEDQEFNLFLLRILTKNYLDILDRYHQIQEESAAVRLCRLILEFSVDKQGRKTLPKYFNYIELSKYLGIHPVTVSRIMGKLKQYGFISKDGHSVVLENEEKLREFIESGQDVEY